MIFRRRAAPVADALVVSDRTVRKGPCSCGFVARGVVPERLCADCGDRLLSAWGREERRLLEQHAAYRDAVADVIAAATSAQERALVSKSVDEPMVLAQLARDNAAKALRTLRKKHADSVLPGSLSQWDLLARALQHDPRLHRARSLRRYVESGLGSAQLTRLAWLAPVRVGRGTRHG
ncbi:MAG: hypothetical protein JSS74_10935 [Actinobacteria bacterium]|nr:hypothetical protein [Actinomycetota bacterium]